MIRPYVIFALPRSRTAWTSHFLSYSLRKCGHDAIIECDTAEQFLEKFTSGLLDGSVETGAMLGHRLLRERLPRVRFMTIRRPLLEVRISLAQFGLTTEPGELESRDAMLDVIEASGAQRFEFDLLSDRDHARRLFESCLELPFDNEWFDHWSRVNVQINMQQNIDRLRQRAPALAMLKAEIMAATRGLPCIGLQ